jgi:hypothetical protein
MGLCGSITARLADELSRQGLTEDRLGYFCIGCIDVFKVNIGYGSSCSPKSQWLFQIL